MIYTDGTIAIKAGSPIVTGTGTQWKKNIHGVAPGQLISIENGTAPVSMMIRAVNSDTELVLSFNAPVTLSGAKYSIATTVPDTISDAARTMSANQGYIVYFLQAMQQWMTDTGQVEIELPNGQKVTLDSIKAINEAISKIPKVVQETGESKTDVMSQAGTVKAINAAKPGDASVTQKGIVQLSASVGASTTKAPHEKAVRDALDKKADSNKLGNAAGKDVGILEGNVIGTGQSGLSSGQVAAAPNGTWSHNPSGFYGLFGEAVNNTKVWGSYVYMPFNSVEMQFLVTPVDGDIYLWVMRQDKYGSKKAVEVMTYNNFVTDGNGFIKKASPIIQIYPDGNYETNDESEGAEVRRTGTGQYHITGILGYNADGAWGVNGGISIPKDNNGLELIYVADRVLEDGSIIIETCHRQHAHLPERFQNWRLKEITPEGERIFYQDGEPCDLPESTRLDVRVEMPQGSVWNVKQRELAEQMEREQAEREAQKAAEQAGYSEE
ncbi:phage tail protein [Morganella morganii]|uniref:phage tail protein n=1 Tax=Morganella morganii TaxID=582 RepID=UPI0021CE76DC|nr:phage tail protein [Morganella morganii]MCU6237528.1 phage tail protein [Morganella morganii]